MNFGILYVATGRKCCLEAIDNTYRTRSLYDLPHISIKTDQIDLAKKSGVFHKIISFESPIFSYRDKIFGLMTLPYEYTLF